MSSALSSESVAVVGNGASVLGSKLGAQIDSHDLVVRFNLYQTRGYEEDVGQRCDLWFINRDATSTFVANRFRKGSWKAVHVHTWGDTARAVETFRAIVPEIGEIPVHPVEKATLDEMQKYLGKPYRMFSTGAIGVWVLLRHYAGVRLFGFDWWSTSTRFHYFDKAKFEHEPGRGHQPALEFEFFRKLAAEGKLDMPAVAGTATTRSAADSPVPPP